MVHSTVETEPAGLDSERERIATLAKAMRRWENTSQDRYSGSIVPMSFDNGVSIPSRIERCMVEAADNPILYAMKVEAREIGWSLHARGGVALMRRLLEGQPPKFGNFLVRSWVGVGQGVGMWGGAAPPVPFRVAA